MQRKDGSPDYRYKKNRDQRSNNELLEKIKRRYQIMYDADHENRLEAMEDLKFVNVPGYQWDDNMKQERGKRPNYEFNRIRPAGKRIINDMRANRPQGKIRAVEGGDTETAEINEGLIRNIWNVADGDTVIDYASAYQVDAGMGAWRVDTEYSDDTAFNQDITIKPIINPFCLYCDPSSKDLLKRDADDWILTEKVTIKAFEEKYGKQEQKSDFEDSVEFDDDEDWQDEESVRLAEYWWKEPHKKEIWMMQFPSEDGQVETKVVDSESDEGQAIAKDPALMKQVAQKRVVMTHKIMSCVASGQKILEGPTRWAGSQFPFIVIYGEWLVIDGRPFWWGLPRFAKDAQRNHNIAMTSKSEAVAQHPKSPFWATADQAAGLTDQWSTAHKKNLPFMLYNPDAKAPGPPARMGPADLSVALIEEARSSAEELKEVIGIYDASVGRQGNETSGRAIYARQQQGEIVTFNFPDNLAKGIKRTYEIILDLIPHIYDSERELRILGSDGAEDYVRVNQVVMDPSSGKAIRINDMSAGKFDVTITVGPSFSTLRQEAAETYGQLGQQFPLLMEVAGDLIFKSMDLPYADDIGERLKAMLPPQIQEQMNQGKDIDPEVQQAMQQAEQAMQQVQQHGQLVQAAAAELEEEKAQDKQTKAEIRTELANVRAAKAEFDAHIAKEIANLVKVQAGISKSMAELAPGLSKYDEILDATGSVDAANNTINIIDDLLAQFMEAADTAVSNLERKADKKLVGGQTRREGSKLVADLEYDDGSSKTITAVRDHGNLKIVPDSEA